MKFNPELHHLDRAKDNSDVTVPKAVGMMKGRKIEKATTKGKISPKKISAAQSAELGEVTKLKKGSKSKSLKIKENSSSEISAMYQTLMANTIPQEKLSKLLASLARLVQVSPGILSDKEKSELDFIKRIYNRYTQISAVSGEYMSEEQSFALACEIEKVTLLSTSVFSSAQEGSKIKLKTIPLQIVKQSEGNIGLLFKTKFSEKPIGKGNYKVVKPALFLPSSPDCDAIRAVEALTSHSRSFAREKKFVRELKGCPGHARAFNVISYTNKNNEPRFALLLERFDNSLNTYELSSSSALVALLQILEGIKAMHNRDIIHGDIKPQNFLCKHLNDSKAIEAHKEVFSKLSNKFNKDFLVVISDYGLSYKTIDEPMVLGYGSPLYASPASILNSTEVTSSVPYIVDDWKRADLWAAAFSVLQQMRSSNSTLEGIRVKFVTSIAKDTAFLQWAHEIYEKKPISKEDAINAVNVRRGTCCEFYEAIKTYHATAEKNPTLDPKLKNDLRMLFFLSRLLVNGINEDLDADSALEDLQKLSNQFDL